MFEGLTPTPDESARRDEVMARVVTYTRAGTTIRLPDFDPSQAGDPADYALLAIGPNDFSGTVSGLRYQIEGEDDLLHIAVMRNGEGGVSVSEARQVVTFLVPAVSPALIWLRPGDQSQHFYLGHDELL